MSNKHRKKIAWPMFCLAIAIAIGHARQYNLCQNNINQVIFYLVYQAPSQACYIHFKKVCIKKTIKLTFYVSSIPN